MTAPGRSPEDVATAALMARYKAPLTSFFLKRVHNLADAEDLTQEVFARIVRQQGGQPLEFADGLIFTIAANLLKDRHRRATTRRANAHVSLDLHEDLGAGDAGLVEALDPERVLIGRERLSSVLRALETMPPRTRDIFLMYRLEGIRQREIAAALGASLSTVEKHLAKALVLLAKGLVSS